MEFALHTILPAVATLVTLGVLFGVGLYVGSRVFKVDVDPRIDAILDALPGVNCGACGFGGCRAYAEAVVLKALAADLCAPGGEDACAEISRIMGVEAGKSDPKVAVVHCRGGKARAKSRGDYAGVADCRGALVPGAGGGATACAYGCLGLGTCVTACPFEAMVMGADGLPQVIERLCTGCGNCVSSCPRGLIKLHSRKVHVSVMCSSREKAKLVRASCEVGCIACKRCVKECKKFEAVQIVDNLAVVDDSKCRNCGLCVKVCPQGTIWNLRKARKAVAGKETSKAIPACPVK